MDGPTFCPGLRSLPESWDLKKFLGKHPSRPFNPKIAYVLFLAGYVESWGRGIEKINSLCRKDNVCLPEFLTSNDEMVVKFFVNNSSNKIETQGETQNNDFDTQNDTQKNYENQIISLIKSNSNITRDEMSKALNISKATIARTIRKSKKISYVGSSKTGLWVIK